MISMYKQIFAIVAAAQSLVNSQPLQGRQTAPSPVALRILPLGASVTLGVGSTTGNSYRKELRDKLIAPGVNFTSASTVNMVGTKKNGNFTDSDVEATGGFVIRQIAASAATAVPQFLPNLILVDAGTNNCNLGQPVPGAGAEVEAMLRDIYAKSPGVTIVLASILANKVPEQDSCRVDINGQYTAMTGRLRNEGAKIVMADMRSPEGPTTNDLSDTRHPNDAGYGKMATVWFAGIQQAATMGFLSALADNGIPLDGGA